MKKRKLEISLSFLMLTLMFLQCGTMKVNMQTNNKNNKKAEFIFNDYFKKNNNSFFLSVGTIGPKYIWTISSESLTLSHIDLYGKKNTITLKTKNNWIQTANLIFQDPNCPLIIDSDVLKFKIKNQKGEIIDKSLIYDMDCLSESQNDLIMLIFADMKTLKIENKH